MGMNHFIVQDTPYNTKFLFDGDLYVLSSVRSIGSGATVYIQGKFGADKIFHTVSREHTFDGGGPFTVDLLESPTLTDGTTAATAHNMNRQSSQTHEAQFFSDPTGISGGTIIETLFIPGGGTGSNTVGSTIQGVERILKKNTSYVIRIANAGGASTFYTKVLFYESSN